MGSGTYSYTYLGFFDKVAEWVFSGISKAISWLFETIFGPIFKAVLEPLASAIMDMLKVALSSVFYRILQGLLRIIDIIQTSFMVFSGVTKVEYKGEQRSLVELFFLDNGVSRAFWGITAVALVLLGVFTLVAVGKKMADIEQTQQRSMSNILTDMIKAMIGFMAIPALALSAVLLSSVVLSSAYNATTVKSAQDSTGTEQTIARTLFFTTISQAVSDTRNKEGYQSKWTSDYDRTFLKLREPWANMLDDRVWDKTIRESTCVDHYIKLWDVDYLVGYFSALFLIWNLMGVSFQFVQRLFEIVLMYLICPFFTACLPLDGGEKLKKWQSLFLGKLGSGIGLLMMVNLYLMLVPLVMNNDINLAGGTVNANNASYNNLIKLIFLLGAAMAVKNGGSLMTMLIDAEAGSSESQSVASGMSGVAAAASWGFEKVKDYASGRSERKQERDKAQKKYSGGRLVKAEKDYKRDMQHANELDARGRNADATRLRNAASGQWNMTLKRLEKKGVLQKKDPNSKGTSLADYNVKDEDFRAGRRDAQGKNGLVHRAKKLVKKRAENKEFKRLSKENKKNRKAVNDYYYSQVKGRGAEKLDEMGKGIKDFGKSISPKSFLEASRKGKENARKVDRTKPTFLTNRQLKQVAAANERKLPTHIRAQNPKSPVERELKDKIRKNDAALKADPKLKDNKSFMAGKEKNEADLKMVQTIRSKMGTNPAGGKASSGNLSGGNPSGGNKPEAGQPEGKSSIPKPPPWPKDAQPKDAQPKDAQPKDVQPKVQNQNAQGSAIPKPPPWPEPEKPKDAQPKDAQPKAQNQNAQNSAIPKPPPFKNAEIRKGKDKK